MIRPWFCAGVLAGLGLLGTTGCSGGSGKAEKRAEVSGTVKLDEKPLADGDISFVGEPGTVPTILPVKNGAFSGQVRVGKAKVEIRAYETKKPPASATGDVTEVRENYIPERFNTNSTLTAEVTEQGITPNAFEVKKK